MDIIQILFFKRLFNCLRREIIKNTQKIFYKEKTLYLIIMELLVYLILLKQLNIKRNKFLE